MADKSRRRRLFEHPGYPAELFLLSQDHDEQDMLDQRIGTRIAFGGTAAGQRQDMVEGYLVSPAQGAAEAEDSRVFLQQRPDAFGRRVFIHSVFFLQYDRTVPQKLSPMWVTPGSDQHQIQLAWVRRLERVLAELGIA